VRAAVEAVAMVRFERVADAGMLVASEWRRFGGSKRTFSTPKPYGDTGSYINSTS
jgi:hypothetical protein